MTHECRALIVVYFLSLFTFCLSSFSIVLHLLWKLGTLTLGHLEDFLFVVPIQQLPTCKLLFHIFIAAHFNMSCSTLNNTLSHPRLSLLGMPGEIRNRIYGFVALQDMKTLIENVCTVCRQMKSEFLGVAIRTDMALPLPMRYGNILNRVKDDQFGRFLDLLTSQEKQVLCCRTLTFKGNAEDGRKYHMTSLFKHLLSNVPEFHVRIETGIKIKHSHQRVCLCMMTNLRHKHRASVKKFEKLMSKGEFLDTQTALAKYDGALTHSVWLWRTMERKHSVDIEFAAEGEAVIVLYVGTS